MKNLFRDSSFVAVANMMQLAMSLISGIIIARILGPQGKGQLVLVIQISSFGAMLISLGLGPSYQYFLRKGDYSRSELVSHMLFQLFLLLLASIGFLFLGMDLMRRLTNYQLSDTLIVVSIVFVILEVAALFLNFMIIALPEGLKIRSIYYFLSGIVYNIFLVLFVGFFRWNITGAVIAYGLVIILRISPPAIILFRDVLREITFNWLRISRRLLIYGISSMFGQLMYSSLLRIDTFIVNYFLGVGGLGVYSIAVTIAELLLVIPSALGQALFPHLTSAGKQERLDALGFSARISLLIGLSGSLLLTLFGYPAIWLVFGERFLPAYIPLLWILPGVIAMTVNYPYANFFSSTGQPYFNAIAFGIGMIFNVGINFVLIPMFGISGASAASSITYIMVSIFFVVLISRQNKITVRELLIPLPSDVKYIYNHGTLVFHKFIMKLQKRYNSTSIS